MQDNCSFGNFIDNLKSKFGSTLLMIVDALAIISSIIAALQLKYDYLPFPYIYEEHIRPHIASFPIIIAVYLFTFSAFRLYRYAWRFASLEILWAVIYGNSIGLVGLIVIQSLIDGVTFPRSVLIILWATSIILVGSVRIMLRVISIAQRYGRHSMKALKSDAPPTRVIILGAGTDGVRVLRTLREDLSFNYEVIGFLDDNPKKKNKFVNNVKVLGPLNALKQLVEEGKIDEVIIAIPNLSDSHLRECVLECRRRKMPVKVVPRLSDMLNGNHKPQLVDFSVEDLLRRPAVQIDIFEIGRYLTGKRVLVTGAGGSIGSELCRQIASLGPSSLILLGHGENSIHNIWQELVRKHKHLADNIHCVIASVANKARISQIMEQYKPEVVFHAAAHKHVPLMEINEREAISNNVLGTFYAAFLSAQYNVERFVLISTDKAADPCCIMGATKRMCEDVISAASHLWPQTQFVAVRFGNVLGSRGSVVPIFQEQIRNGGPVTVTHPEMTRFFMTIPEAVRLVLQAGAVGQTGNIYSLDMGEPVKILDLAKDMIKLFGYEPGVDIEIEFTGIRPGEKLHEEIVSSSERLEKTQWRGLSRIVRPEFYTPNEIMESVKYLENNADAMRKSELRAYLYDLVLCPKTLDDEETELQHETRSNIKIADESPRFYI